MQHMAPRIVFYMTCHTHKNASLPYRLHLPVEFYVLSFCANANGALKNLQMSRMAKRSLINAFSLRLLPRNTSETITISLWEVWDQKEN